MLFLKSGRLYLITYNLFVLKSIRIPRCIFPKGNPKVTLIGFADASSLGYAAALYIRVGTGNESVNTYLLFAKTRLAPLKTISIPRLELCAALLLAKTIKALQQFFGKLQISSIYLLTDSTIVLSWLHEQHSTLQPTNSKLL